MNKRKVVAAAAAGMLVLLSSPPVGVLAKEQHSHGSNANALVAGTPSSPSLRS